MLELGAERMRRRIEVLERWLVQNGSKARRRVSPSLAGFRKAIDELAPHLLLLSRDLTRTTSTRAMRESVDRLIEACEASGEAARRDMRSRELGRGSEAYGRMIAFQVIGAELEVISRRAEDEMPRASS